MVPPMDPVTSFTHLTTKIPDWMSQIDKLSTHAAEKHAEFAAEYSRLLQNATANPKKVKSASISSIHSTDEKPADEARLSTSLNVTSQNVDFAEISPFEAGNKYIYAQARRKRKPTSSVRSGASGPQKFRSKQSLVILYDSYMQEQLDTMVKNIASARNNLRKGKMSRSLQKGLQLPTFGRRFPEIYGSSSEDVGLPQVNSSKSLPIDPKVDAAQTQPPTNDGYFCQTDKELDAAQQLCETAAHQFLRDGDCKVELDGVKARFEAGLALAREALPKFEAEKESEEDQEEARTDSEATLCEKPSQEVITAKFVPTLHQYQPSSTPNPAGNGIAEIEVDDDDDGSSIDVDITKFFHARAAGGRAMGLRPTLGY